MLSARTDEGMANLGELHEWAGVVADSVEKVEASSKELLDKSVANQELLNNLQTINGEAFESVKLTTDIAQKLSMAVQEIGVTLNRIRWLKAMQMIQRKLLCRQVQLIVWSKKWASC